MRIRLDRILTGAVLAAGLAAGPGVAAAQDDSVPMDIDPAADSAPAPAPEPEPTTGTGPSAGSEVFNPAPGGEGAEGAEGAVPVEEQGFYHYDDPRYERDEDTVLHSGPVPELHVVRSGDTLWDICSFYFNNPWEWPKIWSYNPTITNPHWIYPGDIVRMYPAGVRPTTDTTDEPDAEPIIARAPAPAPSTGFRVRQLAFVENDKTKRAFEIVGSEEERYMLSTNDVVYLEYPEGKPPQVGRRYAIYSVTKPVVHPDSKKRIGAYVWVLGELEILSVKKGKRARAIIRESNDTIERGAKVGPLQRTYRNFGPTRNEKNMQGTIVAELRGEHLIGEQRLLFVDLGKEHDVQTGNRLFVVRRGDAMVVEYGDQVGKDDRRFPAYAIGEIVIVEVGEGTSVAMITLSVQEIEVGDHVLMQKGR